jgi:hypothetical protein
MMEFFSSHDGVKDHLGYLSFYPYCTFNTRSDDYQPCNALVPLTSHWYVASPLPCTLLPVSSHTIAFIYMHVPLSIPRPKAAMPPTPIAPLSLQ